MRVLHFLWCLNQGGAENLAVDLANEQCRAHEVSVMVANRETDAGVLRRLDPRVRFINIGRPEGSRNPWWVAKLLTNILAARPDVVHAHSSNFASLVPFISAPAVLTVHANNVQLSRHVGRFAAICCISRAVESDVASRYPDLKPCLVENGIQTQAIAPRVLAATQAARPLRAVQVSRLVHDKKGQDLVVEALAKINNPESEPRVTVDFIGGGGSLEFLRDLAVQKGVSGCCRFLGAMPRDEVFGQLRNYDVLVQPSRDEGFGLTVAEGMAAKLAVIVSDLPGPMEVIGDGRFGYHFPCGDASALARAFEAIAADCATPDFAAGLDAARQFVVDRYDLSRTSDRYVSVYAEAVRV